MSLLRSLFSIDYINFYNNFTPSEFFVSSESRWDVIFIGKRDKRRNRKPRRGEINCFHAFALVKNPIVRVIAKKTLREFWQKHADCEQQLKSWYEEAEEAFWKNPSDIKKGYPNASILSGNRVVFNIKGNNYRLIVKFEYKYGWGWIRFIGTHAEYDKIDANTI